MQVDIPYMDGSPVNLPGQGHWHFCSSLSSRRGRGAVGAGKNHVVMLGWLMEKTQVNKNARDLPRARNGNIYRC